MSLVRGFFGNDKQTIKGTVVLMRKNVLDINTILDPSSFVDNIFDFAGSLLDAATAFATSISIQLISSTKADGNTAFNKFILISSMFKRNLLPSLLNLKLFHIFECIFTYFLTPYINNVCL